VRWRWFKADYPVAGIVAEYRKNATVAVKRSVTVVSVRHRTTSGPLIYSDAASERVVARNLGAAWGRIGLHM
jgi:hypothetical protein